MSSVFQTIGVVGKTDHKRVADTTRLLLSLLERRGTRLVLERHTAQLLSRERESVALSELAALVDLVIVVGGDGSLLEVARAMAGTDVPVLGVNRGRLGFLASIHPHGMERQIEQILEGNHVEDKHFLFSMKLIRGGKVAHHSLALNEVVVHSGALRRIMDLDLLIDDDHVHKQRSDGLIVATPTGSTAYALSAGGPIMHPSLDAVIVVPMFPHTLTSRPLVVQASSRISVVVRDHTLYRPRVSCDGQADFDIEFEDRVEIRRTDGITLLHSPDHSFYEVCRSKLDWLSRLGDDES